MLLAVFGCGYFRNSNMHLRDKCEIAIDTKNVEYSQIYSVTVTQRPFHAISMTISHVNRCKPIPNLLFEIQILKQELPKNSKWSKCK